MHHAHKRPINFGFPCRTLFSSLLSANVFLNIFFKRDSTQWDAFHWKSFIMKRNKSPGHINKPYRSCICVWIEFVGKEKKFHPDYSRYDDSFIFREKKTREREKQHYEPQRIRAFSELHTVNLMHSCPWLSPTDKEKIGSF